MNGPLSLNGPTRSAATRALTSVQNFSNGADRAGMLDKLDGLSEFAGDFSRLGNPQAEGAQSKALTSKAKMVCIYLALPSNTRGGGTRLVSPARSTRLNERFVADPFPDSLRG